MLQFNVMENQMNNFKTTKPSTGTMVVCFHTAMDLIVHSAVLTFRSVGIWEDANGNVITQDPDYWIPAKVPKPKVSRKKVA